MGYLDDYGHYFPIATCISGILSIAITVIINRALGLDIGGIEWPYISDTGKDPPAYYVFAIGLTITAALYYTTSVLFFKRTKERIELLDGNQTILKVFNALSILAATGASPCMALLAIVDFRRYPSLHNDFAFSFFALAVLNLIFLTVVAGQMHKEMPDDEWIMKSARYKYVALFFVLLFFIILYPVLLPMVCGWDDYTQCAAVHTARAAFQHLTVLSLLCFYLSMYCDLRPEHKTGLV